ncbi:hypothetical protein, partial [Achromobacter phage kwar_LB4]
MQTVDQFDDAAHAIGEVGLFERRRLGFFDLGLDLGFGLGGFSRALHIGRHSDALSLQCSRQPVDRGDDITQQSRQEVNGLGEQQGGLGGFS